MIRRLSYNYREGKSPALVFLHGWGLNKSAFDKVVQLIDDSTSFFCFDFFGFGESEESREYYDTYEYAYHIFLHLKTLNIDRVILVGHSFGGRVAVILSSVFNIKVEKLILTSSAGLVRFSIKKHIKITLYKFLKFLAKYKIISQKFLKNCGSKDYKKLNLNMKQCFKKIVNQDLKYLLKDIKCETFLVWDKRDKETPFWMCKCFNKYILLSNILIYQNGRHFTFQKNVYKFANFINCLLL